MSRLELDRRRRTLGGDARAGASLRARARRQQLEFARKHWWSIVAVLGVFAAVSPVLWFQPSALRPYLVGAYVASAVWTCVLGVWQLSGVGHLQLGELAERWTSQELNKLRRDGWEVLNQVRFRQGDVDHVVIGPGGVVVAETKGGRTDWSERRHLDRLAAAARQAGRNAADTRRTLRHLIGDAPVYPLVVIWPAPDGFSTQEINGAWVVPGRLVAAWVRALPVDQLDATTVREAWERTAEHVERRDAYDEQVEAPAPRSFSRWALDVLQYPFAGAIGFLSIGPLLRLPAAGTVVAIVLLNAAAAVAHRRLAAVRRLLYTVAASVTALGIAVGVLEVLG